MIGSGIPATLRSSPQPSERTIDVIPAETFLPPSDGASSAACASISYAVTATFVAASQADEQA